MIFFPLITLFDEKNYISEQNQKIIIKSLSFVRTHDI